jgi:hypothetical protein
MNKPPVNEVQCLVNGQPHTYPQKFEVPNKHNLPDLGDKMTIYANPKTEQGVRDYVAKYYKTETIEKVVVTEVRTMKDVTTSGDKIEYPFNIFWSVFFKSGSVIVLKDRCYTFLTEDSTEDDLSNLQLWHRRKRWYVSNTGRVVAEYREEMGERFQLAA